MKEVWDIKQGKFVELPKEMEAFLDDIRKLYEKHNLCISHEDTQGSFIIEAYNNDWHENLLWLADASKNY